MATFTNNNHLQVNKTQKKKASLAYKVASLVLNFDLSFAFDNLGH